MYIQLKIIYTREYKMMLNSGGKISNVNDNIINLLTSQYGTVKLETYNGFFLN